MQEQSFEYKIKQLIDSYTSIPNEQTINMYIRACFMHGNVNGEIFYRNLKESDREFAYLSLRKSKEDREFYYSKYPNSNNNTLLTYDMFDMTPNKFEDLKVSDLSIEILNFIYFEYFILKQVNDFKDRFNFLVDNYGEIKTHQLLELATKFDEFKISIENKKENEPNIKGLTYTKFYDLISEVQKDINQFVESKLKFIKANNDNVSIVSEKSRRQILLKIIDEPNLNLFYKIEQWLIKQNHLDEDSLKWVSKGGKSSFSRFYYKLNELNIIKQGGGMKRKKKTRLLSNLYKIDGVSEFDYTEKNCEKAHNKNKQEFEDLAIIQSQFNLNSENN